MIRITGGPSTVQMHVFADDVDISSCISDLVLVAKPGYLAAAYVKLVPIEVEIDATLMDAIRKNVVDEGGVVDVTVLGDANHVYRMKRDNSYGRD